MRFGTVDMTRVGLPSPRRVGLGNPVVMQGEAADVRLSFVSVSESLAPQAEAAIGDVVEGNCPLCRVGLWIHDFRACCPCCGDSYRVVTHGLEMQWCVRHGRDCEHWAAI